MGRINRERCASLCSAHPTALGQTGLLGVSMLGNNVAYPRVSVGTKKTLGFP